MATSPSASVSPSSSASRSLSPSASASPSPGIFEFGYGTIGSSSANSTTIIGSKFTSNVTGTVVGIDVYVAAAAGTVNVRTAIYSDVAGTPTALLAQSSVAVNTDTTPKWIDVPTSLAVVSGVTYWLFSWADASRTVYWDAGATNQYDNMTGNTFPTWPSVAATNNFFARQVSIYAVFQGSPSLSPSSSISASISPSASASRSLSPSASASASLSPSSSISASPSPSPAINAGGYLAPPPAAAKPKYASLRGTMGIGL